MIVTCTDPHPADGESCGKSYDDAKRWTICPHRRLDQSAYVPGSAQDVLTRRLQGGRWLVSQAFSFLKSNPDVESVELSYRTRTGEEFAKKIIQAAQEAPTL